MLQEFLRKVALDVNQLVFFFTSKLAKTRMKTYFETFDRPCFYMYYQIYLHKIFAFPATHKQSYYSFTVPEITPKNR